MAAEVHQFDVFALSSRGLMARAIMPNNLPATKSAIASIAYTIKNITDNSAPVAGNLVVADVMFDVAQPWDKDPKGFYILWPVTGTLWGVANKKYRVEMVFTVVNPYVAYPQIQGQSFILVWEANTKDPLA